MIREGKNGNPKGRCKGDKNKEVRGRGEKNTPARYHCFLGKLRTLANGAPDWCDLGEVDWCLSIKCKSILFIPFSFACNCGKELFWIQKWRTRERFLTLPSKQVFWLGMSRVLRNEKVKAISTLASGQDLLAVLKRYPTFTLMPNAACSSAFFSLEGRLCSEGFFVLTKQMWF